MKINVKKNKIMVIFRKGGGVVKITLNGERIEQVAKFELLTNNESECEKKIVEAVVWSVFLYGSETWTMNSDMIQRIEAFEIWVWRRMEKVSWTERKTNEEVLTMMG